MGQLELKAEADKEAAAHEHEMKMAGLVTHPPKDRASTFDTARNIKLVQPLQEKEVDKSPRNLLFPISRSEF